MLLLVLFLAFSAGYNVSFTTLSGLSAGAFMAAQYGTAFSSQVSGVAIFAGGMPYCALGQVELALSICMDDPLMLDPDFYVGEARKHAALGLIDPVANVARQRLFLYSGLVDTVVVQEVVRKTAHFYEKLGANVTTKFDLPSEHCQPTDGYGNPCVFLGEPYISHCGYDGAGAALQALMGEPLLPAVTQIPENLMSFRQANFFPAGAPVPGLDDTAYVYVPSACQSGKKACSLHVSFHGCNQDLANVGPKYVTHSGYNGWAEANGIIVLYPQATVSVVPVNLDACFDWWGYTGPDYTYQTGVQLQTVRAMIKTISNLTFHFSK